MKRTHGFTLIELVVALALAGASVAIGVGAVAFIGDQHATGVAAAKASARQALARAELTGWIRGAKVLPRSDGPAFQVIDGRLSDTSDELSFLTITPTVVDDRYTVVRLYVDRDSTTIERGLIAELQAWPEGRGARIEIEPSVASLDVRAIARSGADARAMEGWVSSSTLPAAVELRFAPSAENAALFRVPMLIALGDER